MASINITSVFIIGWFVDVDDGIPLQMALFRRIRCSSCSYLFLAKSTRLHWNYYT